MIMAQKGYGLIWNGEVVSQLFRPFIVVKAADQIRAIARLRSQRQDFFGDLPGAALPPKAFGAAQGYYRPLLPGLSVSSFANSWKLSADGSIWL
jgi:hypothetical protein